MQRKYEIIPYQPDDPGTLTFERKDVEFEIPAEVGHNSMVYIGRGLQGRKVRIFLMRDSKEEKKQCKEQIEAPCQC